MHTLKSFKIFLIIFPKKHQYIFQKNIKICAYYEIRIGIMQNKLEYLSPHIQM